MPKLIKLDNQTLTELLENLRNAQVEADAYHLAPLTEAIDTVESWVEATAEPERVIFRKFPHNGEVIALFPDQYNPRTGNIGSYMHNGQHADTAPDFGDTKAADAVESFGLHSELIQQGYKNLKVVKRFGKLGR